MGRGKVKLELIKNKISRQVTFSKRRKGLMKKAEELSILCQAEIALIVFSCRDRLSVFSSIDCVPKTIDRYLRCRNVNLNQPDHQSTLVADAQSLYQEMHFLEAKCQYLKRAERHVLGEELEGLNLKEVETLEKQLDGALARVRQRKAQVMNEQMNVLRRSEWKLGVVNHEFKVDDGFRPIMDANACIPFMHPYSAGFQYDPTMLQIGYKSPQSGLEIGYPNTSNYGAQGNDEGPSTSSQRGSLDNTNFLQAGWLGSL